MQIKSSLTKKGVTILEFKNGIPIYIQLISYVKISIVNGKYPPGSKIPAVREMALEVGVNPNTVQRAFTELEREGLLRTERTNGRFVTEDSDMLISVKKNMSDSMIEEFFNKLEQLGMSRKEIVESVKNWSNDYEEKKAVEA